mgnify:CR=1 FL=1
MGQPSSTALAPPRGAPPGRAPDARALPPHRSGAFCAGGSAGLLAMRMVLQFARGTTAISTILQPSAPPRTTPASLARAACCASSPYSGGHVKHKIWRHLPRMPSVRRRAPLQHGQASSGPSLRVRLNHRIERSRLLSTMPFLFEPLGDKEDIWRQTKKYTSMIGL